MKILKLWKRISGENRTLSILGLGYIVLIFPLAYFRHDDWIMLANGAIHLPRDWGFAFKPTLMMAGIEEVWFFRPFFKGILYLFYQLFKFNYFLWLLMMLLVTLAGLRLASSTLTRLQNNDSYGQLFLALFSAGIFFHFGSLAWAGEGLMNCPQLFLLAANFYWFVRAKDEKKQTRRVLFLALAFFCWALSLGFKESGVFHTAFLFALIICEPQFRSFTNQRRAKWLAPYAVATATFLIFRLKFMPFNPGYVPELSFQALATPLATLLIAMSAPFLLFPKLWGKFAKQLKSRWLYLPFFAASIFPYVGHPFFSPGWLLLPGFYSVILLTLVFPKEIRSHKTIATAASVLLVFSTLLVGGRLFQLGWWQWGRAQRQLVSQFRKMDPDRVTSVEILDCPNSEYPLATIDRVAASQAGMHHLWEMLHDKQIPIRIWGCDYRVPASSLNRPAAVVRWKFPNFERLR